MLDYTNNVILGRNYDAVVNGLVPVMASNYLHGYHCTRLTEIEISGIKSNGMSLPVFDHLKARIDSLLKNSQVDRQSANSLLLNNDASSTSRAGRIYCIRLTWHQKAGSVIFLVTGEVSRCIFLTMKMKRPMTFYKK